MALRWLPALLCCGIVGTACVLAIVQPPRMIDFAVFWEASRLTLAGSAAAAYSVHHGPFGELVPLAYPAHYLFIVAPLSLLPFGWSMALWVAVTGALYIAASRAPKWLALGLPPAASNGLIGQNGFLTSAIFLYGAHRMDSRPVLAGAILGLLSIKPQLALLLPVAVIAGRHWKAIFPAAVSVAVLALLSLLVFGRDAFLGPLAAAPLYQEWLPSGWIDKLASIFAFVRWFGAPLWLCFTLHFAVAAAVTAAVWTAWRDDWPSKIPMLAAGTLLVSPYLFSYDAVLLISPIAWLAAASPGRAASVWAISAVPLLASFGLYEGPNLTPMAALLAVVLLIYEQRGSYTARIANQELVASTVTDESALTVRCISK